MSMARTTVLAWVVLAAVTVSQRAPGEAPKKPAPATSASAPAASTSASAASAPTVLASTTPGIMRLVADDTALYWANGKKVQSVDKAGGAVRDVAVGTQPIGRVEVVAGKLYWTLGGVYVFEGNEPPNPAQLFTLTKPSTATRVLADAKLAEPIERVFASGSSVCVYSTNWGTAMFLASGSFQPVCFDPSKPSGFAAAALGWSNGDMHLGAVTADDKNVYAVHMHDDGSSSLLSIPYSATGKSTAKETKLLSVDFADQGGDILATADALIFLDTTGLVRVTKSPPVTRTVLAAGIHGTQLAADATHVYWLWSGKIHRVALNGAGKPQPVVGTKASSFTIDATSIYWFDAGKLSKAPK
ncbi:MAG: hypothetical protein HYV09_29885 [Deltaproteobacteria bacterium]|nr:hypothetical protein [Deltaproteobacteria bacterium]